MITLFGAAFAICVAVPVGVSPKLPAPTTMTIPALAALMIGSGRLLSPTPPIEILRTLAPAARAPSIPLTILGQGKPQADGQPSSAFIITMVAS